MLHPICMEYAQDFLQLSKGMPYSEQIQRTLDQIIGLPSPSTLCSDEPAGTLPKEQKAAEGAPRPVPHAPFGPRGSDLPMLRRASRVSGEGHNGAAAPASVLGPRNNAAPPLSGESPFNPSSRQTGLRLNRRPVIPPIGVRARGDAPGSAEDDLGKKGAS